VAVLFSFLFGVVYFGEVPDRYSLIGSVIVILSCVILSQIRNMKYVEIEE
jgi:drug/metabolite transporter (DMT)-like permease